MRNYTIKLSRFGKRTTSFALLLAFMGLSPVSAMSLLEAYHLMLKNNAEYQAEAHRVEAAAASVHVARAALLPKLNLVASYARYKQRESLADSQILNAQFPEQDEPTSGPPQIGVDFDQRGGRAAHSNLTKQVIKNSSAGASDTLLADNSDAQATHSRQRLATVELAQPIFDGEKYHAMRREKSLRSEAAMRFDELQDTLVLQLVESYFKALNAREQLNISDQELRALDLHQELIQQRHGNKIGTLTDVQESHARRQSANAERVSAALRLDAARNLLSSLTGQWVDELNPIISGFDPEFDRQLGGDENSLQSNHSYRQARQRVQTAKAELAQDRARGRAKLYLRAQSQWNDSPHDVLSAGQDDSSEQISLQLSMPLFAGFGNSARSRKAKHNYRAARAELIEFERRAEQQINDANARYKASFSVYQSRYSAYLASEASKALRQQGYLQGLSSNLDLLDSLRDAFAAQRSYRNALYQHLLSKLQLIAVLRHLKQADVAELEKILDLKALVSLRSAPLRLVNFTRPDTSAMMQLGALKPKQESGHSAPMQHAPGRSVIGSKWRIVPNLARN